MINLGLSTAQMSLLTQTMTTSHAERTTVHLLDNTGAEKADLSERLEDGQVNMDTTAAITRSASLTLFDPARTLSFDSDSPAVGAMYMDCMIRIHKGYWVPSLNRWINVPIFTGPIVGATRDGDEVNVECQGKETLAMGWAWNSLVFKKGYNKVQAIQDILSKRAGENKFDFPNVSDRLPESFSLSRESVPWTAAQTLAKGMGYQLFYDGNGVCRLRKLSTSAVFVFSDGDGGTVMSIPTLGYNTDDIKNTVWVVGGKPKGAKTAVTATYVAPSTEAVNPLKIGRNGVGRYLVEKIEDTSITSKAKALATAKSRMNGLILESVDVSFECIPVPFIEESDAVRVSTSAFAQTFRMTNFSIPLVTGNNMSVNRNNRVKATKRRKK